MKLQFVILLVCLGHLSFAQTNPASSKSAEGKKQSDVRSGYVAVNGLKYYYQIQGVGEPLLLLHGGLGQIEMFGPVIPLLAKNRQVIGVDLHGHGRTALGDRKISLIDMANDLSAILTQLGYKQVDVLGYSLGGGVALRFAIQHPENVRRLVVASAPYAKSGFYPEMLPQQESVGSAMAEAMKETPMYKSYMSIAPKPEEFPKLLDRMGELMRADYDWSEDVKKLQMPVMLIYGDSDMIRLDHVVSFYNLLGGGQKDAGWNREHMSKNRLAILPDLTHYELFFQPILATTALPFLNGKSEVTSWNDMVDKK
jgi:pimeloyl-ACP methyl ester carboxylesterase